MNLVMITVGVLIILLGVVIWRFGLVKLLSNVDQERVIDKKKATRFAAYYLTFLGICFIVLGYFIDGMSERNLILVIACFIPINMVFVVSYMVAQSRNMR